METLDISALIFVVAFLYASVGHGGASGYLAILSFFGFAKEEMASTALILNVIVAGLAFIAYARQRYFSWALTWPFLVTSIPAAFVGGLVQIPTWAYSLILALALLFAAWRLLWQPKQQDGAEHYTTPPIQSAVTAGGGIGLLSGMIGVGGGIFLSPLLILKRWADVKTTSASSALFIIVNAIAGLLGRYLRGGLVIGDLFPFLIAGALGGLLGAYMGSRYYSGSMLRKVLAVVLLIAAFKLFRLALLS